jgi:aspartate aminotransferase-like enzyme
MLKRRLFTPGPVEVPPPVLLAMAQPPLHHRTAEFEALLARTGEQLGPVFGTSRPVLILAASGTGGMEAVATNLAHRAEPAAVVRAGKFGERWAAILAAHGVPVVPLDVAYGKAPDPVALDTLLAGHPAVRLVFLTHSETSTGVLADLEGLARVARARGCLVAVDAITSAAAHEIRMDAWGLDAVVGGSQKGLMLPPGLAFVALSAAAVERLATSDLPRFYFDLGAALKTMARRTTPFTPAVSLVAGLAAALDMIAAEGLTAVFARHAALGAAARSAVTALGFEIFPERPSNVVTVLRTPPGLDADRVRKDLEARFGVKIAGGQDSLKGQILRLGHLGYYDATDLFGALAACERVLIDLGATGATPGTAIAAASAYFAGSDGAQVAAGEATGASAGRGTGAVTD